MGASNRYTESPDGRYVCFPSGLAMPYEPVALALDLERRGFTLRREGVETLVVQPCEQLTDDDCRRIRKWKFHLFALLDFINEPESRAESGSVSTGHGFQAYGPV